MGLKRLQIECDHKGTDYYCDSCGGAFKLRGAMRRSTKANNPCLQKAADDEPLFVLRAQDKLAPVLVMEWVRLARIDGTPEEKLQDASLVARGMVEWASAHGSKVPD